MRSRYEREYGAPGNCFNRIVDTPKHLQIAARTRERGVLRIGRDGQGREDVSVQAAFGGNGQRDLGGYNERQRNRNAAGRSSFDYGQQNRRRYDSGNRW